MKRWELWMVASSWAAAIASWVEVIIHKIWILLFVFALVFTVGCPESSANCQLLRASERVDLIELNHFHDNTGKAVFDQLIFWEWNEGHDEHHVRHWMIYDEAAQYFKGVCLTRNYTTGDHVVRWLDEKRDRAISSRHFRESWTQVDPERKNKRLLAEELRARLCK